MHSANILRTNVRYAVRSRRAHAAGEAASATTTTPADQALGVVNIVVAFAPLKPDEFVVIKIAQLAGQTAGS